MRLGVCCALLLVLLPTGARAAGDPLPPGYLSVSGNQIVDRNGQNVRLACIGYNEPTGHYYSDMRVIRIAGFNCVRYPYYDVNLNLRAMDAIVHAAAANDVRVIFDHHGNEATTSCLGQQKNGLWYDKNDVANSNSDGTDGCGAKGTITYAMFKQNWVKIASYFNNNSTVIGFDLHNEPIQGNAKGALSWGTSTNAGSDMQAMYDDVGSAIHSVNTGALIICEGAISFQRTLFNGVANPMRGATDLTNAQRYPVNIAGKVVYSVHDYPSDISAANPQDGAAKVRAMNISWGYLVTNNIAPVWLGEMGGSLDNSNGKLGLERAWATTLTDYINGLDGEQGGPVFTGTQQPIGSDWWNFGYLPGQAPNGFLNADGSYKAGQRQYWLTLLFHRNPSVRTP